MPYFENIETFYPPSQYDLQSYHILGLETWNSRMTPREQRADFKYFLQFVSNAEKYYKETDEEHMVGKFHAAIYEYSLREENSLAERFGRLTARCFSLLTRDRDMVGQYHADIYEYILEQEEETSTECFRRLTRGRGINLKEQKAISAKILNQCLEAAQNDLNSLCIEFLKKRMDGSESWEEQRSKLDDHYTDQPQTIRNWNSLLYPELKNPSDYARHSVIEDIHDFIVDLRDNNTNELAQRAYELGIEPTDKADPDLIKACRKVEAKRNPPAEPATPTN